MSHTTTHPRFPLRCLLIVLALVAVEGKPAADEFEKLKGKPTNQASKRDNGSAAVLAGTVVLANVFVESPHSTWKRQDRRDVRSHMEAAIAFVERQATRYRRVVTLRQVEFNVAHKKVVPTDLAADPAWTQQVLTSAADVLPNDLAGRLRREHGADHVLFVLHINKPARSYNLSFSDGIDEDYRAERIVCFTCYENRSATAAATYVHEILHGFGAGELYFPYDISDDRKQQASKVFSQDIMYRVDYQLRRLAIGAYTAYRIGWLDTLNKKYRVFEDPN